MKTIGEIIKKARLDRGYTQKELAEKAGIGVGCIETWEAGTSYPNVINLIPVADVLGMTLDELTGRKIVKVGLKPCPFCGSKDVRKLTDTSHTKIWCEDCKATLTRRLIMGKHASLRSAEADFGIEAINAWNRRAAE